MRIFLLETILIFASIVCFAERPDTTMIKNHFKYLTKKVGYRTHSNIESLNKTADYIFNQFNLYADTAYYQKYTVSGKTYKNVICSFGTKNQKRVIIGAHYDVCGEQEGADDNASGVVGLLEIARLLKNKKLNCRIDLVGYSLEEPPYFRSEFMGSYVHAKSLADNKVDVYGMISLEMIGYFKDEKGSQSYPLKFLKMIYGSRGNYITLVRKFAAGRFVRDFSGRFRQTTIIRTKKFAGTSSLAGIDFSDHLNYWKFGMSALMITDTSFYRNSNYHQSTDTVETLDIVRMAKVIDGIFEALISLN